MPDASLSKVTDRLETIRSLSKAAEQWEPYFLAWDVELHILDRAGDLKGAAHLLSRLEGIAPPPDDPLASSLWHAVLAMKLSYGLPAEGARHAEDAYDLSVKADQLAQRRRALVRLIGVHSCQGLLGTAEGESYLGEAERLVEGKGQFDLRLLLRLNRSVWFLDAGEYERAMSELGLTGTLIEGSSAPTANFLLHYNRGECLLNLRDYQGALDAFRRAEGFLDDQVAPYFTYCASAAIGLASLLLGDLSEARHRSALLPEAALRRHYDSSLIGLFESRMHATYRRFHQALDSLERASSAIEHRFVMGWIKLQQERALIEARVDREAAERSLSGLLEVAGDLGLAARCRELQAEIQRIRRQSA